MRASVLTALLLIPLLAGCDRETSGPESGAADVTGSVLGLKTGEGVPNLVAALLDGRSVVAAAPTDGAGEFRFPDVSPGTYSVRLSGLELAGLRAATTAFDPEVREVTVDGTAEPVVFAAVGLFTQAKVMVTCDASPVSGVAVRVVGGATDFQATTNVVGEVSTLVDPGHYVAIVPAGTCGTTDPSFMVAEVLQGQTVPVEFEMVSP